MDQILRFVAEYLSQNPPQVAEKDPTVPDWAKEETKPSYSKSEVGLGNVDNVRQYSASNPPPYPVASVNGKTGAVTLGASDVGALPDTYVPPDQTAAQVGADPAGTAAAAVSAHNTSTDSHGDLRLALKAINDRLTAFFDSDNQTLDELSEIVAYITSNKSLIDSITTSKVSVTDVVNNLTSNVSNKPLSAAQGVVLKGLIDAVNTSLANYQPKGNYLTEETDPTVPSWAKQSTKPSYSKSEVGLGNVDNVKQYSANNPPPYPVTSVNGKTGAVTVDVPTVPTKVSEFTNDAGYLTGYTETDPTVPSWAKATSKPSYTASEVGAVPTSRTVNGKKLSSNITLDASDVGAVSTSQTITVTGVDADGVSHSWTMYGYLGGGDDEPT